MFRMETPIAFVKTTLVFPCVQLISHVLTGPKKVILQMPIFIFY